MRAAKRPAGRATFGVVPRYAWHPLPHDQAQVLAEALFRFGDVPNGGRCRLQSKGVGTSRKEEDRRWPNSAIGAEPQYG
jgi:hypothetical protein